jgi:hypothetical protein
MLKTLSALALFSILVVLASGSLAQECPHGTIGVYFDPVGTSQFVQPVQHENLFMYVILFAEAPVGGAAWKLEMTSDQYSDPLYGPAGPNCQPPFCTYQDPPFWYIGSMLTGTVALGDPLDSGVRQGFGTCMSGFFGQPILLGTVILNPWANMLKNIEVNVTVVPEAYEGLVYADCSARICANVVGLTSTIGATVVKNEGHSWGSVKALYR